ncbi:MAG: type I glyceraldehyde-3-phosphate dehydrogenase [Candidatus Peribacteraceae bacterium]|nr:type I glyceraldehyde-3-phosphate dehydrogenase [Candidatus Peribacteraceae bacterium]MDD5074913.1 type I glyceraldehyde-3-phosphate dehydrogenase [Candidatus Peribacteraceae bacterium]
MNIAINGFGRIGRQTLRIALESHPDVHVVAINDLTDGATLAHLFEFDSTYGRFEAEAEFKNGKLSTKHGDVVLTAEKDPSVLPYKDLKVDIVLECTGKFTKREEAALHLKAGAKKVIISAPGKDEVDGTFVIGVNHETYDPKKMHVISNASCTTNCLAPMAKVLNDSFGITYGLMTTIHSYTNDQKLLDLPHKDLRRARAAAINMIPTSTGAAKAIGLVIPELKGKMNGVSIRVPTPTGSITDLTVVTAKPTTVEEVNAAFEEASKGKMKGILGCETRPLVLQDYVMDPRSSIIDAPLTQVIGGTLVKTFSWYDNEWGYSNRLVELAEYIGKKL